MDEALVITINYETPPSAEEIGALFTALARDYKDYTRGRVLSVVSIEQGSIIATLKDWALVALPYVKDLVEVAKGAKALADFGKVLKDGIESLKGGDTKKLASRRGRKTRAERTMEAALNIAAEHGRSIHIKHTRKNGETFEVAMSAPEAIEIQATLADERSAIESVPEPRIATMRLAVPEATDVIERLYTPSAANLSASETQAIIDVLVTVLENASLGHMLPHIAADLSSKGLINLASALEAKLRHSGRDTEPPVTTT